MKRFVWLLFVTFPLHAGPLEDAGLVDVQNVKDLPVFVSLRYASADNFTHKRIYSSDKCYLHADAVVGLQKALTLAAQEKEPFTFCLWDCYRPQQEHKKLWAAFPNPSYIAMPKKGSRHSRGMAVDLTPCDFNGNPLPMPTDFDNFTPRAHVDYPQLPTDILTRRETLKKIMRAAGFTFTRTEWWHFDKRGWKQKPLLDIPLP
ncbi:MAG: M15 family metallopeptidase [Elusimicrobiaceae bacterium]|nr:M15 family metallopeptidase [Elusimicrobiaceae bacterium]